jgi:hypothetical protein
MKDSRYEAAMSRRSLLTRLAAAGASYVGLTAFTRSTGASSTGPVWDDNYELAVDFQIAQPNEGRYHRPYVAIWVEDASGNAVRTLTLWVNTNGRGPRYIRELRSWFSAEQGGANLISTVSSATRLPGKYSVVWNGRDDSGRPVAQGNYRLLIEAAREHGSHQLIQQDLTLTTTPKSIDLGGNEEIAGAHVEYRRRK